MPCPNAEQAIARLRPRFKRCYQQGLSSTPDMSGSVMMTLVVDGEKITVTPKQVKGLSSDVVACLVTAMQAAQLQCQPGPQTINVPLRFVPPPPDADAGDAGAPRDAGTRR
jgi:hypothetical protein